MRITLTLRAVRFLPALASSIWLSGCASLSLPERMVSTDPAVRKAAFEAARALPPGQRAELVYKRDLMDLCTLMLRGDGFDGTEARAALAIGQVAPEPDPLLACLRYAVKKDEGAPLSPVLSHRFVVLLARTDAADLLANEMLMRPPPEKDVYRRALLKMGAGSVAAVGKLLSADRQETRDLAYVLLTDIGMPALETEPSVARDYREVKAAREGPPKAPPPARVKKKPKPKPKPKNTP